MKIYIFNEFNFLMKLFRINLKEFTNVNSFLNLILFYFFIKEM